MTDRGIIREQILKIIYEHQERFPRSRGMLEQQIVEKVGMDVSFDLFYLYEKKLITINGRFIRITAEGIDYIEDIDRKRLLEMSK